jgi:hypothetical protein
MDLKVYLKWTNSLDSLEKVSSYGTFSAINKKMERTSSNNLLPSSNTMTCTPRFLHTLMEALAIVIQCKDIFK